MTSAEADAAIADPNKRDSYPVAWTDEWDYETQPGLPPAPVAGDTGPQQSLGSSSKCTKYYNSGNHRAYGNAWYGPRLFTLHVHFYSCENGRLGLLRVHHPGRLDDAAGKLHRMELRGSIELVGELVQLQRTRQRRLRHRKRLYMKQCVGVCTASRQYKLCEYLHYDGTANRY